jgi:tRNA 2-selenouridine synthase
MAITKLNIEEFLLLAKEHPILDVRSPGEFKHAHIPGAHAFPLFSDEERKIVGTAYKQESKQKAIKLGLDFFGVKMVKMVEEAEQIVNAKALTEVRGTKYEVRNQENFVLRTSPVVLVHCWRGGMRSAGVAWLLDLYGFKVYTLVGGYKVYRKWVLQQFEKEYPLQLLGGYTGSGKTEVLHSLQKKGHCVIDLEYLASHKGSAFGSMGMPVQPSQEMFENLLAKALHGAGSQTNSDNRTASPFLWIEDESQRIGEVNIPTPFFKHMRSKKILFLNIPFENRLNFIVQQYGHFEKEKLVNAIIRIKKRLGGLETKTAINYLLEDNMKGCFGVLLHYYDKFYLKSLHNNRDNFTTLFHKIDMDTVADDKNAGTLLSFVNHEKVI